MLCDALRKMPESIDSPKSLSDARSDGLNWSEAQDQLDAARSEYERIARALTSGQRAPQRGPAAEGITLYGGLDQHQGNGSIPRIAEEAQSMLFADLREDAKMQQ